MKRKQLMLALLLLSLLTIAVKASADEIHTYLNLSYTDTTAEEAAKILLDKRDVEFEVSQKVLSGKAQNVPEFGYLFDVQIDFRGKYRGINRILLHSAQPVRIPEKDFKQRALQDLQEFVDVERQLTEQFGKPDEQFFYINKTGSYMFASGQWELEQFELLCLPGMIWKAYSVWENVVLHSWIDWSRPNVQGEYLSRVMLYYYPDKVDMLKKPTETYPMLGIQKCE